MSGRELFRSASRERYREGKEDLADYLQDRKKGLFLYFQAKYRREQRANCHFLLCHTKEGRRIYIILRGKKKKEKRGPEKKTQLKDKGNCFLCCGRKKKGRPNFPSVIKFDEQKKGKPPSHEKKKKKGIIAPAFFSLRGREGRAHPPRWIQKGVITFSKLSSWQEKKILQRRQHTLAI